MTIPVAVCCSSFAPMWAQRIEEYRCLNQKLGHNMANAPGWVDPRMFPCRRDREGWLATIAADGHCLAYCPMPWMSDKEIVLAAVRQDGLAVQYAHGNMRRDNDVRIEAVRQNMDAIEHCLLYNDKWFEKFCHPGVTLLAVMGTEGAPLCTVAPFVTSTVGTTDAPGIIAGTPYEAHWGLGGRTITGVLDRSATIGDLAIAIHDQAPVKGRFCLIMPGNEEPMTPVDASMSITMYLLKQHLKSRLSSFNPEEDD